MDAPRFQDMPPQIAKLPVDKRGFPVPWFVPWFDEEPEFRAVDPRRVVEAHTRKLCWVCGERLSGGYKAFTIGPMCAVNRVSAEPPAHILCARFAVKACPFLSRPLAKRADISDMPYQAPPGMMIERNPGVILIWVTQTYRFEREPHGSGGLFRIGAPSKLEWYARGRQATRAEVIESIEGGLPELRKATFTQSDVDALKAAIERAVKLVPNE